VTENVKHVEVLRMVAVNIRSNLESLPSIASDWADKLDFVLNALQREAAGDGEAVGEIVIERSAHLGLPTKDIRMKAGWKDFPEGTKLYTAPRPTGTEGYPENKETHGMSLKQKYTREQAYDKLYVIACKLLERMSACSKCPIFAKDTVAGVSCGFSKAWCCEGCAHLGPTGCTVEPLLCRLHLCADESARQWRTNRTLRKRLNRVREIARSYNLLLARATKKEVLEFGEKVDMWYFYRFHAMKFTGENI
jgi:hypothetical protein